VCALTWCPFGFQTCETLLKLFNNICKFTILSSWPALDVCQQRTTQQQMVANIRIQQEVQHEVPTSPTTAKMAPKMCSNCWTCSWLHSYANLCFGSVCDYHWVDWLVGTNLQLDLIQQGFAASDMTFQGFSIDILRYLNTIDLCQQLVERMECIVGPILAISHAA
jgi:hypothetical protein